MNKTLWDATVVFFGKMVNKLIHQKSTHGYRGWNLEGMVPTKELRRKLAVNIEKGDWVDVANLAMMLDYRKNKE